tara:strand:+ start:879 stop:1184 length:306 start_codon:yes stop_codon:yes gene_type:complete
MIQPTAQNYLDVIQEMINKANSMKDETNDIYWQEFSDRLFIFDKLRTNLCYWAPEIIRQKFWTALFKLCNSNFNNASNPIHRELFEIYQRRYKTELESLNN